MSVTEVEDLNQLSEMVGTEIAVSDWIDMPQTRIDQFAEATQDHQWIHVDPDRSKKESPYGNTIAHGFLTLSMIVPMMFDTIQIKAPSKMGINYGLNRVRFPAAVPSGGKVRGRFTVSKIEEIEGGFQMTWNVVVECQGSEKPCCVAEWITRRYE